MSLYSAWIVASNVMLVGSTSSQPPYWPSWLGTGAGRSEAALAVRDVVFLDQRNLLPRSEADARIFEKSLRRVLLRAEISHAKLGGFGNALSLADAVRAAVPVSTEGLLPCHAAVQRVVYDTGDYADICSLPLSS